jgi:apolipoprotein N-acyltransferase
MRSRTRRRRGRAGVADRATRSRRWLRRGAAALAGVLPAFAFPAANLWWLGYVGLVPVLLLISWADDLGDAAWRTWFAGAGFFAALHHWLLPDLGPFMVPTALVLGATWLPIGLAVWWTMGAPPGRARPPAALAALTVVPAVWVLAEFARSWELLGGSWGFLGASQWQVRPVLALAAVGGVWAISVVLMVVNVAVAVAVRPGASGRVRLAALGTAAMVVVATLGWGAARPEPTIERQVAIGGVQPGHIHDPGERLRANEDLSAELDPAEVDLVVWGQSSVGFDPSTEDEVRDRLEAVADELGVPVLVNVDARRPDGRITKTATLVRPGVGLDDTYAKQRLVPFGEYIPLRPVFGWVADVTDAAGEDRVPGADITEMRVDGLVFGPVISYESTFPDLRRAVARLGVELTVVQAASTTFQGSWAQPQQASYEAVRAVESGRPAVLVAVSGTSAAFDARGRQLAWVPSHETGAFVVNVPLSQEDTPYVRYGDWVPALALVVVVVAGAVGARRWWGER